MNYEDLEGFFGEDNANIVQKIEERLGEYTFASASVYGSSLIVLTALNYIVTVGPFLVLGYAGAMMIIEYLVNGIETESHKGTLSSYMVILCYGAVSVTEPEINFVVLGVYCVVVFSVQNLLYKHDISEKLEDRV